MRLEVYQHTAQDNIIEKLKKVEKSRNPELWPEFWNLTHFVDMFVQSRVMFYPMYPVDSDIIEDQVQQCRNSHPDISVIRRIAVEHRPSPSLVNKDGEGKDIDGRHSNHRALDL